MAFTKSDIKANQNYLRTWDKYRLEWMNTDEYAQGSTKPLLLPINVNIAGGIMQRSRIKTPQLRTIMGNAGPVGNEARVAEAVHGYYKFFDAQDTTQSGTPPSPLDFNISCPVIHLFHLPRENWKFTDHTQFSVDNVPPGIKKNKLFEILGVVDNGRGLMVANHNWRKKGNTPFAMKFNLHVSILQENDGQEMRTDIIIDPIGNSDSGPVGP